MFCQEPLRPNLDQMGSDSVRFDWRIRLPWGVCAAPRRQITFYLLLQDLQFVSFGIVSSQRCH